jgi:hypothetical protein
MSPIGYKRGRQVMPLGTLHTVRGIIKLRESPRFLIVVDEGGEWELELLARLTRYIDHSVTIEGVRTDFNRLEVMRINRDGRTGRRRRAGRGGSIAGGRAGTARRHILTGTQWLMSTYCELELAIAR